MKQFRKFSNRVIILSLMILSSGIQIKAERKFVHPGCLLTMSDYNRISQHYQTDSPWKEGWIFFMQDALSSPTRNPTTFDANGEPVGNRQQGGADGTNALYCSIIWRVTGDTAYANHAVKVLNVWAKKKTDASCYDLWQLTFPPFIYAAENLHNADGSWYSGWKKADVDSFLTMARDVMYASCHSYMPTTTAAHPSWPAPALANIIALGVLLDDEDIYNEGIAYFRGKDNTTGSVFKTIAENGQSMEMSRDQAHALLGIGAIGVTAQVAWCQGDNLYAEYDNRVLKGYDYWCHFNLNHPDDVIWNSVLSYDGYPRYYISTHNNAYRLNQDPSFEMVYNHYAAIDSLDADRDFPWLKAYVNAARPEPGPTSYQGYGTAFYTQDASRSPLASKKPGRPTNVKASNGLNEIFLTWDAPTGDVAKGYNIYRQDPGSTSYKLLESLNYRTTTSYIDQNVTASNIYSYRVTAINYAGESIASFSSSATPTSGDAFPSGWSYTDVGSVDSKGVAKYCATGDSTFYVSGGGAISGTSDGFGFMKRTVSGDFSFSARMVQNVENNSFGMGIMACETLFGTSRRITAMLSDAGTRYSRCGFKTELGGTTSWTNGDDYSYPPFWYRIERIGNKFSVYQSRNGKTWFLISSSNVSLPNTCYIGFFACGTNSSDNSHCQVWFDQVKVTTPETVGISEEEIKNVSTIFNLSDNHICINLSQDLHPKEIFVFNPSGEKMITAQAKAGKNDIDISSLPTGVYIIKIIGNQSRILKFIKK